MDERCSIFLDPCLLAGVLIQGRLNRRPQPTLIIFLKRNEPERLPRRGNRTQHLCRAKHRPTVSQEHHLDAGTPIQHVRHAEQAAGERNALQLAGRAVSVWQPKDGRRDFRNPYARASVIRVKLGEVRHVSSQVWYAHGDE